MWLSEFFKNLLQHDDDILLFGTVGILLSMDKFDHLVRFVFVVFDEIIQSPDGFYLSV